MVVLIQLLSKTRYFFVAGLAPLFPTFSLISHYIVGAERPISDLKETIVFGMLSLIPYFVYLAALYCLAGRLKLVPALLGATFCWFIVATALTLIWHKA